MMEQKIIYDKLLEIEPTVNLGIIKETLTRMGIANKNSKILYPSCYVHMFDDKYYLIHFKQMFMLTRPNGYDNMATNDFMRRNAIAYCLKHWKLINVNDEDIKNRLSFVYILSKSEKDSWTIKHKFKMNPDVGRN